MTTPSLKKFISDQEEAVQLARDTVSTSDSIKIDSINVALSIAHSNSEITTIERVIEDAKKAEKYLRGDDDKTR